MKNWIYNPKLIGSGIIECIPQQGKCPNNCSDCFFQSGRSYLEPLKENLPHIPTKEMTKNRIVRMNDGNDSNHQREIVENTAKKFEHYFYNTAIPKNLDKFEAPFVITINPAKMTDNSFYRVEAYKNLMFVRIRTNIWNLKKVVVPAIKYYSNLKVKIVLTYMAYYNNDIPLFHKHNYIWKKRTINSYWCLKPKKVIAIERKFQNNVYVYSCTYKNNYSCSFCGNCIREYYNSLERLRKEK